MEGLLTESRAAGWFGVVVLVAALTTACTGGNHGDHHNAPPLNAAPKVIIDSDYNTMGDDGQAGVMAAQLQTRGTIQVMGISVVSGNQWLKQGVADAVRSTERLGMGHRIGVYPGENHAFNHTYADIQAEAKAGAGGDDYLGAWNHPEPRSYADLVPPPDGFANRTMARHTSAIDFIIDTIKHNPHQITILAIGPVTNIAAAIRRSPDIVGLIKQIIYTSGAFHVAGNTTKAADFNWWFDPDAARFVVRQPIAQVVLPLDVTDTVALTKPVYDHIAHAARPTAVTEMYRKINAHGLTGTHGFEDDPNYAQPVWDTLTVAYLLDPSYATKVSHEYVDVVAHPGTADNGRSIGYDTPPPGTPLQKMTVVEQFDNARFFNLYVDLLTSPVQASATR